MPEYRQGVGPNRLPQGGAQQVNTAQPPAAAAYQDMDIPVEFAPGVDEPIEDNDRGMSENMQVLLSPPDEGYRQALIKDRQGRVPRYAVRHLPTLMAAARQPDAPPTLRALYRKVLHDLEAEARRQ